MHPIRILFVGDTTEERQLLARSFRRYGYAVEEARTGPEALARLASSSPPPTIVVLSDLEADAEMDACALCEELRDAGYEHPILFLSARTARRDKLLAFEAGADDYVTKPFSLMILRARIEVAFRRHSGLRNFSLVSGTFLAYGFHPGRLIGEA